MSFALDDYKETLERIEDEIFVKSVIAAWGESGDYAEWSGGFLCQLLDGRYAYITGWCDTTGWGCQEGVSIEYYEFAPSLDSLVTSTYGKKQIEWEMHPVDLNEWVVKYTTIGRV